MLLHVTLIHRIDAVWRNIDDESNRAERTLREGQCRVREGSLILERSGHLSVNGGYSSVTSNDM